MYVNVLVIIRLLSNIVFALLGTKCDGCLFLVSVHTERFKVAGAILEYSIFEQYVVQETVPSLAAIFSHE